MTVLLWALGNKNDQRGFSGQNTDESQTLNLCFLSLLFPSRATWYTWACMRESCSTLSKMENCSPFSLWNTLCWIIFSSFIMVRQSVGWGLCVVFFVAELRSESSPSPCRLLPLTQRFEFILPQPGSSQRLCSQGSPRLHLITKLELESLMQRGYFRLSYTYCSAAM